ncbi:hypothetical protein AX14_005556, partial [Amanita brunnescens Koide BX004]
MGDNMAQSAHITTHINGNHNIIVLTGTQPTPSTPRLCVEQGGVQESDQQSYPKIPVDQDSVVSSSDGPQIDLGQSRVPSSSQDNASNAGEPQITPVQPPGELQTNKDIPASPLDPGNAFEPEVKAEYTEPDAPSSSSTSYPYKSRARPHIYSFDMLTHRAGYPLYVPAPLGGLPTAYRKKGIRVGDVGVITTEGAFDFLFNACQSDPGINPPTLPDGFELLKPRIRTSDKFGPGISLPSDDVREISDGKISFQCLAAEGAVLVLQKGATIYQAMNKADFQSHAARHAISWYKYMLNEGLDVSNGSLYFVTECIKSVHWGIAVFYADPIPDDYLRFIAKEGSCLWEQRGKVESKIGPNSKDIIPSDDEEPNQCVFLRGYKVMLRSDIWDKLKGAVAVTTQDGEFSSSPSTRTTNFSLSQGMSGSETDSFHQSTSENKNTTNSGHSMSQYVHTQTHSGGPTDASGPEALSDPFQQVILDENFREEAPLHPSDLINTMLL